MAVADLEAREAQRDVWSRKDSRESSFAPSIVRVALNSMRWPRRTTRVGFLGISRADGRKIVASVLVGSKAEEWELDQDSSFGTIDYIFFLRLDLKTDINPNEVSDVKWVSKADLEEFFKDPTSTFTPWFRLIGQSFLYKWWDALLASRKDESQPLEAKALIAEVEKEKATMGSIIRM
ncbi:Isopentenyl-diphosphate Delta-isomerase [Rhodotorula toruloides ATCC 204091]|uniref:BY PROTMAP: gi/342319416/gb/EGU11365.1/ Isopentenyl-diphosphate Delta-isomerase [Rhodotorula glutinis ATCC 204091] n=1 Tax=Rhodotorula toruloides TaxID=5286 RepID=A0A0K3CIF6_RHOTO|nr:Isopentenyl-diphosphate Delta-isomerase [Rhodotorula toruloides ATCC 204091]